MFPVHAAELPTADRSHGLVVLRRHGRWEEYDRGKARELLAVGLAVWGFGKGAVLL
jgi:hypothetical protein